MDFVAVDDQVGDRSLGVGAVDRDAESVAAAAGRIATGKCILDVMDVVLQEFDVRAGSDNAYAERGEAMLGGAKVANLEALDSDVTLIVDRENAGSGGGCEMRRVENCCLAWVAAEGDEAVARISGGADVYELFVDSAANVDGAASAGVVRGVLDRAPRRSFSARVGIISVCGYIKGSAGLAERCGDGDAHE